MKNSSLKLPRDIYFIIKIQAITALVTFYIASALLLFYLIPKGEEITIRNYDILYVGFMFTQFFFILNILVITAAIITAFRFKSYKYIILRNTCIPFINIPIGILYYNIIF